MDRVLQWLELPIRALLWLGLLAGFLMMLHVGVDVAGRTVFNHPFAGTTEIVSAYYMVAAAYLPWAWIARNDNHIRVDLFARLMPRAMQTALGPIANVLTIIYVSLFTWQTFVRAVQQTEAGEVWQAGSAYVPVWPSRWMLPIAGGLMVLYLVLRLARDASRPARLTEAGP
jgi:TRAP-type C4-dicarboxylate transport system permease small subunit